MARNIYFDLTEELNAHGRVVVLCSGQAVVHYRVAIMSKDGDWIIREDEPACRRVLEVLAGHQARYRPSAPLDPRWLSGGWSSHFEFVDERGRRVRCDFFSRAPRIPPAAVGRLFAGPDGERAVVDLESLIYMKRTRRAKDYAVIGELARLLAPSRELELTTDPDAIVRLAPQVPGGESRRAVRAFREGGGRDAVVVELAREIDRMQREDRQRLEVYEAAAQAYLRAFRAGALAERPLGEAHPSIVALAESTLPVRP